MKKFQWIALLMACCFAFGACGNQAADLGESEVVSGLTLDLDYPAAEGLPTDYEMPEEYIVDENVALSAASGSGNSGSSATGGTYTGTISIVENIAPGTQVFSKNGSAIDVSNASQGYVMVKQSGVSKRLKVQIVMGDKKYNYDLNNAGNFEAFPLQMGNGNYKIRIMQNKEGNSYVELFSAQINVTLDNSNAPFLCPSQYVNYSASSAAVKKSFDLCVGASGDVDRLKAIYTWIIDNISYDTQKAETVQTGYLPKVDDTLSTKTGICFDYASLMACMLRAQGIPTKLVIGTVSPKDLNHAWNEVYLKGVGWVTVRLYFSGNKWERMDATFGASGNQNIEDFIGNGENYTALRIY